MAITRKELNGHIGTENINYTTVNYEKTLYDRHTTFASTQGKET